MRVEDANGGPAKGRFEDDGTHYKISGQKMWISNAGILHLFIVFARIEDDQYITGFIVENDPNNGNTLGEEERTRHPSSSTRQVFLAITRSLQKYASERGHGFKIAMNALNIDASNWQPPCLDAQRRVIHAHNTPTNRI